VAVLNDLIFRSKVEVAARAAGVDVEFAARAGDIAAALGRAAADVVVVDMDLPGEQATQAIAAAAGAQPRPHIVAFVAHVDRSRAEAARAAGADEVLARSAFHARLPELLTGRKSE
jgi:DNA-binding NarL/FixJ family response regulator